MDSNTTTEKAYRLLVVALVVGLVAQASIAPAMAATASTPDDDDGFAGDPCGRDFGSVVVDVLSGNFGKSSKCEAQELVANATFADLYASALAQSDLGKAGLTPISNHVSDSKTFARTIAKAEAVREFNNGTNRSQIYAEVNSSVDDYYTTMQQNVEETHQTNQLQAWYVFSTREDTGVGIESIHYSQNRTNSSTNIPVQTQADITTNNRFWINDSEDAAGVYGQAYLTEVEVTYVNGTTENTTVIAHDLSSGVFKPDPSGEYLNPGYDREYIAFYGASPDADLSCETYPEHGCSDNLNKSNSVQMYDEGKYVRVWQDIEDANSAVKINAKEYVDGLFNTYNQSEGVPVSEVLDPLTLTAQFNTDFESTGYYGWIASEMGLSGLEGNINSSFVIEYTPAANHTPSELSLNGSERTFAFEAGNTTNMSGTLMTDWAPASTNGSFVVNETYDTANADSPVLFIEQVNGNESRVVSLNGTFEVSSLTNVRTGESVNETTLEEQNQQTWEANTTEEQITYLIEWRDKSTENFGSEESTTSPEVDFGNISPLGAGVGALVVLALVVVVGKEFAS